MMMETTNSRWMLLTVLSGAGNHYRDSASSIAGGGITEGRTPFPSCTHHFRHKRAGVWKQGDMKNTMKKDRNNLSRHWKPPPKHQQFNYLSKQHQEELYQESAVQAELQRIARDQMMEMEMEGHSIIY